MPAASVSKRWPVKHPITPKWLTCPMPAAVAAAVRDADLVIGAVPGFMGFATLKAVIEAGKNVVDISFFDEDPFELDALATANGVTAVMDCGVAPGLSNMVLGYHAARMTVESFRCMVGGLPVKRSWPWQYKAPFSPIDVLEEYTRPARLVENGEVVVKPALSDPQLVEIEPVGTLEAFNTDGLRTLLVTMSVPDMAEKTLRYPGHIDMVRVLRDNGFLDKEPVDVRRHVGAAHRPGGRAALPAMAPGSGRAGVYRDGDRRARPDRRAGPRDRSTGCSTAPTRPPAHRPWRARPATPARPWPGWCWRVAFQRKGICPPEFVGADERCFERVVSDLKARGVVLTRVEC